MKKELFLTFTLLLMISTILIAQTPDWQRATQAGGTSADTGFGITIDDSGNSYVTGCFNGTGTFGSYNIISNGQRDAFVAKIDANGNWQWVTQAGGVYTDIGRGITIDDSGNTIVTGYFVDTATFGSYPLTSSGYRDIFVGKMNADGNWLWATQAGGNDGDYGNGISIDVYGNSYVIGEFWETATFGSYSLTSSGSRDIFVGKMNADGNWLWATQAGGSSNDIGQSITTDAAGNCYVTGFFNETATFGPYSLTSSGQGDVFVAKIEDITFAENQIASTIVMLSNHPNPFNPSTTIDFTTQNNSNIELTVYNIKGHKIKTLANNDYTQGNHSIIWNGDDEYNNPVSSGIYYYKLNVNGKTEVVKKCLLLK
ncbi:MAG: SBBP repeat-containing protein [Candidatus Tenebribacter burtonii]|nr:SBBP repeat-containing protein [Candidatus Tenebribacter burtonii]